MLGIIIKSYLEKKGISQAHLSRLTNIGVCRMSQILNGTAIMKADEYILICLALDVSCDEFVGGFKSGKIK